MPLRCLIVDNSRRFLKAARELLEREGISVVGVAETVTEAHRQCSELRPDVTLVDIDLGEDNGIELARELAADCVSAPHMILISAYSGDDFLDLLGPGPALPFLPKSELSGAAIRHIVADAANGHGKAGRLREAHSLGEAGDHRESR